MCRCAIVLVVVLAIASVTNAGVVVTVGDDILGGLFDPGATVTMNIALTQDSAGADIGIRGLEFDLADTAGALAPANFAFDYSDVALGGMFYAEFPSLLNPAILFLAWAPTDPLNLGMLVLPASNPVHLAPFDVTLPMDIMDYAMDVTNGEYGFFLTFGFDVSIPYTTGRVETG